MNRSLPIIRDVPCSGKRPAGLRDLDQIKRALPARPVDSTLQCFLQGEDGFNIQDELTNLGIFDDLGICRPPDSGRIAPESTQTPFPLPSHSPGATRRGQRRFFNPDPQTTFEDCSEIINIAIPPPTPPPPPPPPTAFTPTLSECRDEITFSWEPLVGFDGVRVETGSSEFGPWSPYLTIDSAPNSVKLVNYFDGAKFIRFSARAGASYVPFLITQPAAAVVAPPTFVSLSNVVDRGPSLTDLVTSPLNGEQVKVVSEVENPLIGLPGQGYVEVRRRVSYFRDPLNPPSLVSVAMFSHPDPGVTIRFTTDNTTPTLITGQANNTDSAPYDDDFGHIIRAVAIKDGCTSPETIIAVDKDLNAFSQTIIFVGGGSASTSCDLPREEVPQRSAVDCDVAFGGIENFVELVKALACSSGGGVGTFNGGLGIWRQIISQGPAEPVNGFTPYAVSVTQSRPVYVQWNRPVELDFYPPALHTFVTANSVQRYAGTGVTGPGGSMLGLTDAMYSTLPNPSCPTFVGGQASLSSLTRYTSRIRSEPN